MSISEELYIQGRIIKGVGGLYTVDTAHGRFICRVRGIFRKDNFTPLVGDRVFIEPGDDATGIISRFAERANELVRPRVANVDQVVIVLAAARPAVNMDMLDRLLLLIEERKLDVLICINKSDLTDKYIRVEEIYKGAGYKALAVSAKTGVGIAELCSGLTGRVSVLAGPSGVGKSSIVNILLAREKMTIGALSEKIGRGKHTTRHTELMELERNTYIVDTPGFSSLSLEHLTPDLLAELFREFRPYLGLCRFNDCMHINEPDCAIKAQVGHSINIERYRRYFSIWNEINER